MSRAVGIKGRGTEMCSVLVGRAEGIILPGFGQAYVEKKKEKKKKRKKRKEKRKKREKERKKYKKIKKKRENEKKRKKRERPNPDFLVYPILFLSL